jgi:hypothetical protein
MEPTLGLLYKFPIWEIDDDWRHQNNAQGRIVNGLNRIIYPDNYGIFVGTHGEYNLFTFTVASQYHDENIYQIFYIKKNAEIEEMDSVPEIPYIDYVEWFVGSPMFPHPVAMDERRTTYLRVTDTDIEAAWRQHLQDQAIAHGKKLSAKKVATYMALIPPAGRFSGGPLYKRAKANFKAGSRKQKSKGGKKRKTRKV